MLYYIIRPIIRIALRLLYRNIHISGSENIPRNKPVLLVSNHPTAFLEPCILACFLDHPLYFMVSGRFFYNKLIARIFNGLHMLPIYNLEDGIQNLRSSVANMELYQRTIASRNPLLIYAESSTKQLRYMRRMKRGFIRLGFKAMENFDLEDVYLVPVGCNYRQADRKRSHVYIDIDKPLNLKDYFQTYKENAAEATNQVLETFTEYMNKVVVSPNNRKADKYYDKLLNLIDNELHQPAFPVFKTSDAYLKLCRRFISKINNLNNEELQEKENKLDAYLQKLKASGISDAAVSDDFKISALEKFAMIIGWLPAWIGKLIFWPLKWIEKKTNTLKRLEFRLSVYFGSAVGYVLSCIFISVLFIFLFPLKKIVLIIIFIFIFGFFSIYYFDQKTRWESLIKASKLDKTIKIELKKNRSNILDFFYQR